MPFRVCRIGGAGIAVAAAVFWLSACSGEAPVVVDGPEPMGEAVQAVSGTVQDAVSSGCSTTAVWGLSKQIVAEVNCLVPNGLAAVPDEPNLSKGSATFAYLQTPAKDALVAALNDNGGMTLHVNSMLRTVAQQYLLYAWYQGGTCGIQLAAVPGSSNHEQGLAFDTSDYNAWMGSLSNHGFRWFGSADVVHFDYVGSGAIDLNGKDVLAFQKLWNLNNPSDPIAEDGQYGPETESRLQKSPADGFATGAPCSQPPPPPQDAGVPRDAGKADTGFPVESDSGAAPQPAPGSRESADAEVDGAPPDTPGAAPAGNGSIDTGGPSGCSLSGLPVARPRPGTLAWTLLLIPFGLRLMRQRRRREVRE